MACFLGAEELPKVLRTHGAENGPPQGGVQELVIERKCSERRGVDSRLFVLGERGPVTVGCFLLGLFAGLRFSLPAVLLHGSAACLLLLSRACLTHGP